MAITVWGRATSSNVQVVMWAIGELGLEYVRHDVGHKFGGTDTPEYLAMNPNGKVPTIKDGDLVLYESQAILRYLAAKYGDAQFWPTDLATRAELDLWCEWIRTTFQPHFNYKIFWQMVRVGAAERDEAQIARDAESLKPVTAQLEKRIGAGPFLNGEYLCWADIVVGHLLYRYYTIDFDKAATPNLDAYYQRLTERPAYAEHAMVSYELLRVP
ncbi:MAG: glutathione S-transferase family protein [Pseudomonadota bacterium]